MNRNVTARAVAVVLEEIGQNSTPSCTVNFKLEGENTFRRWNGWLSSDKAVEMTIKSLRNMGFTGNDPFVLDGATEAACTRLLPDLIELVLEDEEGNDGKTYENVRWVNRIGSSTLTAKNPVSKSGRLILAQKFKAAAAAYDMNSGAPKTKSEPDQDPNNGAEVDEFASLGKDDLPF